MISWFKSLFKEKEEEKEKDDVFVPPETRIIVVTLRNGEVSYSPQYRYKGDEGWGRVTGLLYGQTYVKYLKRGTLEYSQAIIDMLLLTEKERWNQQTVKVEYVKYP